MNNNSPPLTFKRFQTIVSRLELPRRPLPPVTQQQMDKCCTKIADNHDQLYSIPSLEELGMHDLFLVKVFLEHLGLNLVLRIRNTFNCPIFTNVLSVSRGVLKIR